MKAIERALSMRLKLRFLLVLDCSELVLMSDFSLGDMCLFQETDGNLPSV